MMKITKNLMFLIWLNSAFILLPVLNAKMDYRSESIIPTYPFKSFESPIPSIYLQNDGPIISATNSMFPKTDIGDFSFTEITVSNKSPYDLIITSINKPTLLGRKLIFYSAELDVLEVSESKPMILGPYKSKTFTIKFLPEKDRSYLDSVVFHSNAIRYANGKQSDSVSVLYGFGNKRELVVTSYDWGRKRIYRDNFPILPHKVKKHPLFPDTALKLINKSSVITKIVQIEEDSIKGDLPSAFPLDKTRIFGHLLGPFVSIAMPAYFLPRTLGEHYYKINFITYKPEMDSFCILKGFGVVPRVKADDLNFVANEQNNAENPIFSELKIINTNASDWLYYDTLYITDFIDENLGTDLSSWGDYQFRYDKSKINFPIILKPGDIYSIPIEFKSENMEAVFAYLTTKSDAVEDIKVKITGYPLGTSVKDNTDDKICISPNPVNDKIYISNIPKNIKKIIIFDATGKELKKMDVIIQSNTFEICTNDLPNGSYILRMIDDSRVFDKKFYVLK